MKCDCGAGTFFVAAFSPSAFSLGMVIDEKQGQKNRNRPRFRTNSLHNRHMQARKAKVSG
jgi:hypothetical protein